MTRTLVIVVDIAILCTFIESVGEMSPNQSLEGGEVIAEAKVEALVGFVLAVRNTLMVDMVIIKGMMIGIIIMKAEEKGIKVQVLAIGEDEVEALEEKGIVAQSVRQGGETC
ncbi:hypothetical protein Goarm_018470 [Gossypium armourianum]|uniref:Uncharacterized protein n=1 Tax=Gossypium armourianum TaxID=34283 RepID=A0A7J9IHP5_9ROSI|nr:hypothetical protein [Gossypium armourianum]